MALRPFANLPLKVLSLLVAVVLWLAVSGQSTVERNIRVPLEYQNEPPGMDIVGDPPDSVDVRLRGSSGNLARVVQGDVVAALDLTNARPGTRIFNLHPSEVRVPFGVQVVQVTPPTVSLDFEYSGQKVVPVSPVIEGDPEPGFVVGRITTSPATVQVLGPMGRLDALREATTEPVRVDGARKTVQDRVTVGVEDSAVRLREPLVAVVTVEIVPAPVEQTLEGVRDRARQPRAGPDGPDRARRGLGRRARHARAHRRARRGRSPRRRRPVRPRPRAAFRAGAGAQPRGGGHRTRRSRHRHGDDQIMPRCLGAGMPRWRLIHSARGSVWPAAPSFRLSDSGRLQATGRRLTHL